MNTPKCRSTESCAFKNINSNISDDNCRFEGYCTFKIVSIPKCTFNNNCNYENNNCECTLKSFCKYQSIK